MMGKNPTSFYFCFSVFHSLKMVRILWLYKSRHISRCIGPFYGNEYCYRAMRISSISRYNYEEFNFSFDLSTVRENFVGQEWLFEELEDLL